MDYRQRKRLEAEYGKDIICGYVRLFYRSNNNIRGACCLNGESCCRSMTKEMKPCKVYATWLIERQKVMREEGLGYLIDQVETIERRKEMEDRDGN